MAETMSFRTDEATLAALAKLTEDGTSASDAIRNALIHEVQFRANMALFEQAKRLAADPDDHAEAMQILEDMGPPAVGAQSKPGRVGPASQASLSGSG